MGGCRCSYRNCTSKSDGKIHMFHYPVFDKIRCHQWLTNAHKLEFLNLKVSQLKNRVVCQHHFLPHHFMNFLMDKLKFDAVPTENGPFCNSDDNDNTQQIKDTIDPEEIDVEPLSIKEKVASLKVKFAEFLCNSDVDPIEKKYNIRSNNYEHENSIDVPIKVVRSPGEVKKHKNQTMLLVSPFSESTHKILGPETARNILDVEFERDIQPVPATRSSNKVKIISEKSLTSPLPLQGKLEPVSPSLVLRPRGRQNEVNPNTQNLSNKENAKLLHDNYMFYTQGPTENAIIEQMPFDPQVVEANRCTFVVSPIDKKFEAHMSQQAQFVSFQQQAMPVSNEGNNDINEKKSLLPQDQNMIIQNRKRSTPSSPSASQVKGRIPPERIAAIEEKRNFNKKLRDMIEFCLDELDSPDKQIENKQQKRVLTRQPGSSSVKVDQLVTKEPETFQKVGERDIQQKETRLKAKEQKQADSVSRVASHLSKEPSLPSTGEYAMAALEERLKKMENTLLHKIDQNSKSILDLKNTIESTSIVPLQKASVMCQTKDDVATYKQQLFKEISQFLRPKSKNLIYEEMFLNKFSKDDSDVSSIEDINEFKEIDAEYIPPKRRTRRRCLK